MLAILLYPINLLLFALRYWTIPTVLAIAVAVAVPTALVLTGGPTKLDAAEYRAWCEAQSDAIVQTFIEELDWSAIEQQFEQMADDAGDIEPPPQFANEHETLITSAQKLADLPLHQSVELELGLLLVRGLIAVADTLTGSDLRQQVTEHLTETGLLEGEFHLTLGGSCGVDWDTALTSQAQEEQNQSTPASEPQNQQPQRAVASQRPESPNNSSDSDTNEGEDEDGSSLRPTPTDSSSASTSTASEAASQDQDTSRDGAISTTSESDAGSEQASGSASCRVTATELGNLTESLTFSERLTANDCRPDHYHMFTIDHPTQVTITLQSTAFDAFLLLHKRPTGLFIAENDDFWDCCDARIEAVLDPGAYTVTATSYGREGRGLYQLTITLEQNYESDRRTSEDQWIADHGSVTNLLFGRSLPQISASLTDRQQEVRLGPWFYQALFQFSERRVEQDQYLGLIGYMGYGMEAPDSACRDESGYPTNFGWDAQPYEATPAGRQSISDWRTRSWHSVYSVIEGVVAYTDEQLGKVGIFDGRNTLYYRHLNEISPHLLPDDGLTSEDESQVVGVAILPGDYIGRMGMRGTALAPHLTLEVRAGPPPHDLCPTPGTSTSPLPYLYRLLGGQ